MRRVFSQLYICSATINSLRIYLSMRMEVFQLVAENFILNKSPLKAVSCLASMTKVYTVNISTTLRANVNFSYAIRSVSSNFSKEFKRHPIDHGYDLVEIRSVLKSKLPNGQNKGRPKAPTIVSFFVHHSTV